MCKYLYQEIHIQSAHTSVSDLLPFEYAKPIEVNIDIMPHKQPFYVATTLFAINFLCSVWFHVTDCYSHTYAAIY